MIISSFHPVVGGSERQAKQLAAKLMARGVDVCVLTRRYAALRSYEKVDGIPVHRAPAFGPRAIASIVFILSSLIWLFFNQHRYQIVHCHQVLSPATIGSLAKMLWGKRLVVKIPGAGSDGGIAQVKTMPFPSLRKRLMRHVDQFVYLSDAAYEELVGLGLVGAAVKLPNGVDTDRFGPVTAKTKTALRESLGLPHSRLVIFTGRVSALKRLDILLKSWASVVRSPCAPSCHLLLLGEGERSEPLKTLARRLDIEEHLSFLGERENVVEYLQASDVFVLPSESEGISNSLLEAMACGLATVATDVGGTGEVLRHQQNGLLVAPKNQSQLTEALLLVLKNRTLAEQLGHEARNTAEARYSLDAVVEQYVGLYNSLL
jgi:glycosyltransferase involved in cell wall biosynthesis